MTNWGIMADFQTLRQGAGRQNGLTGTGRNSVFNNDGMDACGFSGIFMTRKLLGLLSEFSRDSTKPMKIIAKQENKFWKDCEKRYSSIKLLDTFE